LLKFREKESVEDFSKYQRIAIIKQYMESHNQNPKAFVWIASVDLIINNIKMTKDLLVALFKDQLL